MTEQNIPVTPPAPEPTGVPAQQEENANAEQENANAEQENDNTDDDEGYTTEPPNTTGNDPVE